MRKQITVMAEHRVEVRTKRPQNDERIESAVVEMDVILHKSIDSLEEHRAVDGTSAVHVTGDRRGQTSTENSSCGLRNSAAGRDKSAVLAVPAPKNQFP